VLCGGVTWLMGEEDGVALQRVGWEWSDGCVALGYRMEFRVGVERLGLGGMASVLQQRGCDGMGMCCKGGR